jgi:hypothetical protein
LILQEAHGIPKAKPPDEPAASSKLYQLFLRRHYPDPVQTVGDEFGRPLSLVYPSSRQNCVRVQLF